MSAVLILLEKRENEKEKKMKHAATLLKSFWSAFGHPWPISKLYQTLTQFLLWNYQIIVQLSQKFQKITLKETFGVICHYQIQGNHFLS